ncbi:MAG: hypothetical protein OEO21_09440, partial [Candidatus Krumholzibacteria bacterium]|nr:hypothetical protein [Candidatus Krumholzibacteria bacterium]
VDVDAREVACIFRENGKFQDGGGMIGGAVLADGGSPEFRDCTFISNAASGVGALACGDGSPRVVNCLFQWNWANGTGGLGIWGAGAEVVDCRFIGNASANASGGGINAGRGVVIRRCLFDGNDAIAGAGISGWPDSIIACTFLNHEVVYRGGAVNIFDAVVIDCTFLDNFGIESAVYAERSVFDGCAFVRGSSIRNAAVHVADTAILRCTFYGQWSEMDGAAHLRASGLCSVRNSIISYSEGPSVICDPGTILEFTCNNVYGNAGGDSCVADQIGINGNISLDPLYCDAASGDFTLRTSSPCLTARCGAMGAFGLGCWDEAAAIASVTDVAGDQGGSVRVRWYRALNDAPDDSVVIAEYRLYRRRGLDAAAGMGRDASLASPVWERVATSAAIGSASYDAVASTQCDSTYRDGCCWTVFKVRTVTDREATFFDSAPDSGYSVDNIAPAAPGGLQVIYDTSRGPVLSWRPCADPDFSHFNVYRSVDAVEDSLVATTKETRWTDLSTRGVRFVYKVSAVDRAGNESERTSVSHTRPTRTALHQNVPNPFNPSTRIRFDVHHRTHVVLAVYDVQGHMVRELVRGDFDPESREVEWDGFDARGRRVASGIYFCRLLTSSDVLTRKMVLLR